MSDSKQVDKGLDKFLSFMSRKGLNITAHRKLIARAFFEFPGHHTLEEFYQHVQTLDKSIGQTTVYRTVKLLCDAGLARELHFTDSAKFYENLVDGAHHDHLMCVKCGRIIEIYDSRIEELQKEIAKKNNFTLLGHYHVMYGLCEDCRKARDAGDSQQPNLPPEAYR